MGRLLIGPTTLGLLELGVVPRNIDRRVLIVAQGILQFVDLGRSEEVPLQLGAALSAEHLPPSLDAGIVISSVASRIRGCTAFLKSLHLLDCSFKFFNFPFLFIQVELSLLEFFLLLLELVLLLLDFLFLLLHMLQVPLERPLPESHAHVG